MKNGKRLNRRDKAHLEAYKLNPDNWLLAKRCSDMWLLVNKISGKTREIPAPR